MRLVIGLTVIGCLQGCSKNTSVRMLPDPTTTPQVQWITQTARSSISFRGLSAVSAKVAWASGTGGTYARTINGGRTWHIDTVPDATSLDFRDIHGVDENTAHLLSAGRPARIYKTTDGGRQWTEQYTNDTEGVFFDAMAFWNADNGIAFSDPVDGRFLIITTTDGGRTWNRIDPDNVPAPLPGEAGFAGSGTCIAVHGANHVWIATGGLAARVLRSTDRGKTWTVATTPMISGSSSTGIFSIAFRDATHGVAVGGDYTKPNQALNHVATTEDGGLTWTLIESSTPAGYRSCVAYIPSAATPTLIAVGPSGSDRSTDDGRTWRPIGTVGYHTVSSIPSGNATWAAGPQGRIAKLDSISHPPPEPRHHSSPR